MPTSTQAAPEATVMQMVTGAWLSKAISEVTCLDVPDLLERHGPLTAEALVHTHGVPARPDFLARTLRACASAGLFTEDAEGRYGPTDLSRALTADAPGSVKKLVEIFGRSWWRVWTGLGDAIRTGEPQAKAQLGMEYWDYCRANPREMEDFGQAMKANSGRSLRGLVEHADFSQVRTLADVGGGFGHLAIALLERWPDLRAVVYDMPDLVPIARRHAAGLAPAVTARLEFRGGDMFEDVPDADAYVMKHIIHDWDDERCVRLLGHCRTRATGPGRVICVDAVLPPLGDPGGIAAKLLDLNMMVFIPGKERTRTEWEALYAAAGLRVVSVMPLADNFGTSIIEGR